MVKKRKALKKPKVKTRIQQSKKKLVKRKRPSDKNKTVKKIKSSKKTNSVSSLLSHMNEIIKTQSRLAMANFNLNTFMNLVVEQMHLLTNATGVVIELVSGNEMVYRAATGTVAEHIGLRLPVDNSISGLCVTLRKILRCNDTEKDSRVNVEACRRINARSLVVAPLFQESNTIGVLKIISDKVDAFNEADIQTLQLMAGFIGSGIAHQIFYETTQKLLIERTQHVAELQKAQIRLKYLAEHDYLTKLASRSLFKEKLTSAIANNQHNQKINAVLAFDIDHFKSVNDTLGHDIGDALLKAFTLRVKNTISSQDVLARIGGDEFILLAQGLNNEEDAIKLAKRIMTNVREPFKLSQHVVKITTSIGISLFRDAMQTYESLVKQADLALYSAKAAGRDTFILYQSNITYLGLK